MAWKVALSLLHTGPRVFWFLTGPARHQFFARMLRYQRSGPFMACLLAGHTSQQKGYGRSDSLSFWHYFHTQITLDLTFWRWNNYKRHCLRHRWTKVFILRQWSLQCWNPSSISISTVQPNSELDRSITLASISPPLDWLVLTLTHTRSIWRLKSNSNQSWSKDCFSIWIFLLVCQIEKVPTAVLLNAPSEV